MKLKVFVLMLVALLFTSGAKAYDFEVKGIYYYILDAEAITAQVCSGATKYSGEIVIPANVSYDGADYTVTSIGYGAFSNSSVISVTIPNSVTSIGWNAFYKCSDLISVTLPNSITSIGRETFRGCASLTSVTIPSSVSSIEYRAFDNCSSLTSIKIPNSVKHIESRAFYECSGLTSIEIPNSVTSIGAYAFSNCSSLASIEIPESVNNIGNVKIPNSITSIEDYTFSRCSNLKSVVIPNSVTDIGGGVFEYCSCLASVTSLNLTPPICLDSDVFSWIADGCVIHVPAEAVDAYKTAYVWKNFSYIEGDDTSSIVGIDSDKGISVKARYDLNGNPVNAEYRGVVIEVLSDGRKVKRILK